MAKIRRVWVRALKSFGDIREGDEFQVNVTEGVAHLIVNHYLTQIPDPPARSSN